MDLRTALEQLARLGYSHRGPKSQRAQAAHYELRRTGINGVPLGLEIRVSGQGQSLPVVPWLTFLDPDVTTKVTEGLYIVYLFSADLRTVYLTLNQGATAHRLVHESRGLAGRAAQRAAIDEIVHETTALRTQLAEARPDIRVEEIDLGSRLFLPTAYEAGAITCQAYDLANLPTAPALLRDLSELAGIYPLAVDLKDQLVALNPAEFRTPARSGTERKPRVEVFFRPKDAGDYIATVPAHVQYKSRKHEALLAAFATAVSEQGWTPNSNVHPRDLEVTRGFETWLVEAKTVGQNAEHAVREAIGQLFSYRHFCYRASGQGDPHLLALFSEPIGDAFVLLLADLEISTCWRQDGSWKASHGAQELVGAHSSSTASPLRPE